MQSQGNTFVLQKLAAFFITLTLFYFCWGTQINLMLMVIVLGYGHFLLGYFYKIMSRKVKLKNALLFIVCSAGLFFYFYRINFPDFRLETLLLAATVGAIYHAVTDDQFALNGFKSPFTRMQKILILMLTSSLVGLHLYWQFGDDMIVFLFGISFALGGYFLLQKKKMGPAVTGAEYYVFLLWLTSAFLYLLHVRFYLDKMLLISFIGIYHYLVYYFHYYSKIKSLNGKTTNPLNNMNTYLGLVAGVNAVVVGLFFYNQQHPTLILATAFRYNLFLVLTLMHIISSTRLNELRDLLSF